MDIKLRKIDDVRWEIPIGTIKGMNVPGRVIASEKLVFKMKQDRTLSQLAGVTTLPGIYKHAIVLPDGHEGYGFPIGGVAALDFENGGISPGGIGYDINCLPEGSKVLTKYGYWKKIEDIKDDELISFNTKTHAMESSKPIFLIRRHAKKIYEITTETGDSIRATGDHPFLTPNGMIEAKNLKVNDLIAFYPFKGVEFEKPKEIEIVNEKKVKKIVGNREKIIKELKKRKLLPLYLSSEKIPILARLAGYLTGDGHISCRYNKKNGLYYWYTHVTDSVENLKEVAKDIKKLGFKPYNKILKSKAKTKIFFEGKGVRKIKCYKLVVPATSFAILMKALGVPEGREVKLKVPTWIKNSPKWILSWIVWN